MTADADYWVLDTGPELAQTLPAWVGLVSETDGGVVAVGRRDIIEACAEALNAQPNEWDGPEPDGYRVGDGGTILPTSR